MKIVVKVDKNKTLEIAQQIKKIDGVEGIRLTYRT